MKLHNPKLIILSGAVVGVAAVFWAGKVMGGGPEYDVAHPDRYLGRHNFGQLNEGQNVRHTFKVKNDSGSTWHVVGYLKTCGCIKIATQSAKVAPGEYLTAVVDLDTQGYVGAVNRPGHLIVNPGRQLFACDVAAYVVREPILTPRTIVATVSGDEEAYSVQADLIIVHPESEPTPQVAVSQVPNGAKVEIGAPERNRAVLRYPIKITGRMDSAIDRSSYTMHLSVNGSAIWQVGDVRIHRKKNISMRPSFLMAESRSTEDLRFFVDAASDWELVDSEAGICRRDGDYVVVDCGKIDRPAYVNVTVRTSTGAKASGCVQFLGELH